MKRDMVVRAREVVGALLYLTAAGRLHAQAALEPPAGVGVCQVEYGQGGAPGTLLVSWTNAESYESAEFSLDGAPAPGEIDGTFGAGRVQAPSGKHLFGVRGLVGERASPWSTAEFVVLGESPLLRPIEGLDCEVVPERGGKLRLTWTLGPDAWASGRLEVPGQDGAVEIPAGALSAEIDLLPPEDGGSEEAGPRAARLAFKSAQGYSSPPYTPLCVARTPAFRRGDCDSNGRINITDPIVALSHLFLGAKRWQCDDACDANDDGGVNLADPVTTLVYLFQSGDPPPAPGPRSCGVDPSPDFLGGICECK